jgi:hypothetical protein
MMMIILKNIPAHPKKTSATLLKSLFNVISASSFTYYTVLRNYIKLINIGPDRWMGNTVHARPAFSLAMAHHKNRNNSII